MESTDASEITKLLDLIARLRNPKDGCPWDLEQTHHTLIPYVLEEAHEVVDAIRNGNDNDLIEELGDLLLQVVLHAQIANEQGRFDFGDITKAISQKIIRRHPHVFIKTKSLNCNELKKSWEAIKASEKPQAQSNSPLTEHLQKKIRGQSELAGAMYISKKVAEIGFEWESINGVWDKVNEEIDELKKALSENNRIEAESELGDLLFALVNIARWAELNPEEGLAGTNQRFLKRFYIVEETLDGKFSGHSLSKLTDLWKTAKARLEDKKKKTNPS